MSPELIKIIPNLAIIENVEDINESTRIKRDLKMSGEEARRFLFTYGDKFNVDLSRFRFGKYFFSEMRFIPGFLRLLNRRNDLTVGELEAAIPYKRLDENVLKKIRDAPIRMQPPRKKLHFKGKRIYSAYEITVFVLIGVLIFVFASVVAVFLT